MPWSSLCLEMQHVSEDALAIVTHSYIIRSTACMYCVIYLCVLAYQVNVNLHKNVPRQNNNNNLCSLEV